MNEEQIQAIKKIKLLVKKMLVERNALLSEPTADACVASPSSFWSEHCEHFKYMIDLPEEYFTTLRKHTFHLTGDTYLSYMPPRELKQKKFRQLFDAIWSRVPQDFWISEPQQGYGFYYKGCWVNHDVCRYQSAIDILYAEGIFRDLRKSKSRINILEIGAGFGGLLYHISKCLSKKDVTAKYFIIDLPEVLLFSAAYLSLYQSPKSVYLYDSENIEEVKERGFNDYKFILIPNYQLELLSEYKFDLVLNMASFQEMRKEQINQYLDFINEHLTGVLFSHNIDINIDANIEGLNLKEALERRFKVKGISTTSLDPINKIIRDRTYDFLVYIGSKILSKSDFSWAPASTPYKYYICRPKKPTTYSKIGNNSGL